MNTGGLEEQDGCRGVFFMSNAITATGAQSWLHELKDADELREFFAAVKMFGIGASNASLSAPLLQRHA